MLQMGIWSICEYQFTYTITHSFPLLRYLQYIRTEFLDSGYANLYAFYDNIANNPNAVVTAWSYFKRDFRSLPGDAPLYVILYHFCFFMDF